MRYLAELAWAPDAILLNPDLNWRATDDTHLIVSAGEGSRRAEITLALDREGGILEAFASDRPRAIGRRFVSGEWRGVFSNYSRCEGRLVPMSAEVGWVIEGSYEPVWRGKLAEWRTTQASFGATARGNPNGRSGSSSPQRTA